MLLFATNRYGYFRDELAPLVGSTIGQLKRKTFEDGEFYHRLVEPVAGQDAVLVGGTISEPETLELFDIACALVYEGVRSLTLVVPYLGYSTMDRAVAPGEIVKAKTRARLLSSIPCAAGGNRVAVLDLHAEGIQYYFEGAMRAIHVYGKSVVLTAIRDLGRGDFVLACTDAGRAKWVESLANEIQVSASFIFKKRLADGTPVVTAMSADVQGRRVIVYDDMIRSGGSLLRAAEAYRQAGASDVQCVTTHGLFPGDALAQIRRSGLVSKIVCTNSHARAVELAHDHNDFLQVRSVCSVFVDVLQPLREGKT